MNPLTLRKKKGYRYLQVRFFIKGRKPIDRPTPYLNDGTAETEEKASEWALEERTKLMQQYRAGYDPLHKLTIGEACKAWWDFKGEKSYPKYKYMLDWVAKFLGEGRALETLTGEEVGKMVAARRKEQHKRPGHDEKGRKQARAIKDSTVDWCVTLLRMVVQYHTTVKLLQPFRFGTYKTAKKTRFKVDREISMDAELAVLRHAHPDLLPVLMFLIAHGVRLNEALGLEWARVNMRRQKITFPTKNGDIRVVEMAPGVFELFKNEFGKHPQFVFTFVARKAVFKERLRLGRPIRMVERTAGDFIPMTEAWFRAEQRKAFRKAQKVDPSLIGKRPHDYRHTFACRTLRARPDLNKLKDLMGHADLESTLVYTPVTKEAAERDAHQAVAEAHPEMQAVYQRLRDGLAQRRGTVSATVTPLALPAPVPGVTPAVTGSGEPVGAKRGANR